jgi:hypothetical protein
MIISHLFLNTGAAAFTSAIPVYAKPTTIPAFPRIRHLPHRSFPVYFFGHNENDRVGLRVLFPEEMKRIPCDESNGQSRKQNFTSPIPSTAAWMIN